MSTTTLPPATRTGTPPQPAAYRHVIAVGGALAACAIVAWGLIVPGPFDWQLSLPQTVEGGAEAILLMLALALLQAVPGQSWRLALSGAVAALYLRRHGVDAAVLLTVFYLEFAIALGAAVQRAAGAGLPRSIEDYLRCFLLGLAAWSVSAWSLSAFGQGRALDLRYLSLLLLIPALWARARPLSLHLWARSQRWAWGERALFAVLAGWMLVLYARTEVAFSFDGLWYGLRPEDVLTADGSVFDALALVSPVHYFPKLYEVFLLPLSGLGDASALSGVTILVLGLIALTSARIAARLGIASRRAQLALGALVLSLPALANAALEPKPDILCALALLLAWLFGGDWLLQRRPGDLAWALSAAAIALSSKLIAVPYLGLLGIALAAGWRACAPSPATTPAATSQRLAWIALALATTAAAFVMARTWLLAGMPTIGPDPLYKLWTMLGFHLHEPAGTMTWATPQQWDQVPGLILDWLLRPHRMEHIAISWPGNVWLWLPLCGLLLRNPTQHSAAPAGAYRLSGAALALCGAVLALGWQYHARGSDGNYFIVAVVAASTLGFAFAWRCAGSARAPRASLLGIVLLFAAFQAGYAFVSAAWTPGTRAFDLDFLRSPRDLREADEEALKSATLQDIAYFLRARDHVARAIGCAPFRPGVALPARFEDLPAITLSRPEYTRNPAAVLAYMRRFGIQYLLLPRPDPDKPETVHTADDDLCKPGQGAPAGTRLLIESTRFRLLEPVPATAAH